MRPRLFFRRFFPFLLVTVAAAQDPKILANHGDPMLVPYACAEEELAAAGMSCTASDPCPVYLELGAIVANGSKLLAAGDLHSSSATLASILLLSEDSAATWKEPATRIPGATIDQLQLSGPAGWAAGESLYPLPRDPFVLLTTDTGASWRKQPIGEEDTPGTVQRFWFDSPRHGELIVDAGKTAEGGRYRVYESDHGGAAWNLTAGSDRPTKLKNAPPDENPEWRVATSKDGKAIGIERRFDGEWIGAASFTIEVAQCGK